MSDLKDVLKQLLDEYGEKIREEVEKAIESTAKATDKYLAEIAPKDTKAYARGFAKTKIEASWKGASVTIYNKSKPTLTHLLNDGWAMRNGERHEGDGHIDKGEQYRQEELQKEVEALLNK